MPGLSHASNGQGSDPCRTLELQSSVPVRVPSVWPPSRLPYSWPLLRTRKFHADVVQTSRSIHVANPSLSPPEITCPKCLNRASHHAHQRWSTGCRLHEANVTKCLNVFAVSILGGGMQSPAESDAAVGKSDLENPGIEESTIEDIYEEMCNSIDSHVHTWSDLSDAQREKAVKKAIGAYDKYGAWDRTSDMSESEFKIYKRSKPNVEIVVEDTTTLGTAKREISSGEIIGKFRILPRGYKDRTWESNIYSTSPTVSQASVNVCEIHGLRANLFSYLLDFADAFFQQKSIEFYHGDKREVFLKLYDKLLTGKDYPIYRKLIKETPGCKNSASRWFQTISSLLVEKAQYRQASFDKSYFIKIDKNQNIIGIIPLHVDDSKCRLTDPEAKFLEKLFREEDIVLNVLRKINVGDEVEFCGKIYVEKPDGVVIHQWPYLEKKLALMPKLAQSRDESEKCSSEESKSYGTAIGQLIWCLPTTFVDSYEITFLARFRTQPTVGVYRRLNETIFAIKAEIDLHFVFLPRFRADLPVKTVVVCDASAGEAPPQGTQAKHKDHQCQLPFLAEGVPPGQPGKVGLILGQSSKITKVTHASFDSESINNVDALDLGININESSTETQFGVCPKRSEKDERKKWMSLRTPLEIHSDALSFIKLVRIGMSQTLTRRRARDIDDARQALEDGDVSLFMHIRGVTNPADIGTKRAAKAKESKDRLRKILHEGFYKPDTASMTEEEATCLTLVAEILKIKNFPTIFGCQS